MNSSPEQVPSHSGSLDSHWVELPHSESTDEDNNGTATAAFSPPLGGDSFSQSFGQDASIGDDAFSQTFDQLDAAAFAGGAAFDDAFSADASTLSFDEPASFTASAFVDASETETPPDVSVSGEQPDASSVDQEPIGPNTFESQRQWLREVASSDSFAAFNVQSPLSEQVDASVGASAPLNEQPAAIEAINTEEWEAIETEDGRVYYWNVRTDEVSWSWPPATSDRSSNRRSEDEAEKEKEGTTTALPVQAAEPLTEEIAMMVRQGSLRIFEPQVRHDV